MKQNELIEKLTAKHQKKPLWKKRGVLLGLWFAFNVLYFCVLNFFFSALDLRSSVLTLSVFILVSVFGWLFFSKLLNADESNNKFQFFGFTSLLVLIASTFFYDEFVAGNILHERPMSLSRGDLNCFTHTILASLGPLVLGSVLIRSFFVTKKKWAASFLALHVSVLAILWTEMTCYDREMWHLFFGHESSILGIFTLLLILFFLLKRRASSVV